MLKEFKEFISKGNVVDMAVGLVTGSAFTAIVTSLVNDIISPLIGLAVGGLDFAEYRWVLRKAGVDAAGNEIAEVAVKYGSFIQSIFNFLIVAFCIFMVVKAMNKMREAADKGVGQVLGAAGKLAKKALGKEEEAKEEAPAKASAEEVQEPEAAAAPAEAAPAAEASAAVSTANAAELSAMASEEIALLKEIRDLLKKE